MKNSTLIRIALCAGMVGWLALGGTAYAQSSTQGSSTQSSPGQNTAPAGNTGLLELPPGPVTGTGTAAPTPATLPHPPAAPAIPNNVRPLPPTPVTQPLPSVPITPATPPGTHLPPPPVTSPHAALATKPVVSPVTVPSPAFKTPAPAASHAQGNASDIIAKNPELLLIPLHLGKTSMMFSKNDMNVIIPFLEVYDSTAAQKTVKDSDNSDNKDDLSSLLQSLRPHDTAAAKAPPPLPNIYLGSIVYYSPSHWSVWINDKKLVNSRNQPTNEFYVSRLSRAQVELVWKPHALLATAALWKQMTGDGKNSPPRGIVVDVSKGIITLQMRPNQTFLPRSLTIREGLIRPGIVSATTTGTSP